VNIIGNALAILAASIVPFTLNAQTVYESTNEQGVTEFSDQPSDGASAVKVNPNVIEAAPTPEIETYKRPEKKQAAATAESAPQVETEVQVTPVHTNTNPRLRPNPLPTPRPTPRPAPAPR
jgi:hypothetical protein